MSYWRNVSESSRQSAERGAAAESRSGGRAGFECGAVLGAGRPNPITTPISVSLVSLSHPCPPSVGVGGVVGHPAHTCLCVSAACISSSNDSRDVFSTAPTRSIRPECRFLAASGLPGGFVSPRPNARRTC